MKSVGVRQSRFRRQTGRPHGRSAGRGGFCSCFAVNKTRKSSSGSSRPSTPTRPSTSTTTASERLATRQSTKNNDEQHSPSFSVETTCPLHLTECSCEESFQRICPNECSAYPAEVDGARGRAPFARLSHADLAAARSQMQIVNKKQEEIC